MEHVERLSPFPWRTAALVVSAVAAAELVALLVVGATHLAPAGHHTVTPAAPHPRAVVHREAVAPPPAPPSHPLRPRSHVSVLVLNGNGLQGAAGREAVRLQTLGYRVAGAANAPRHDYARSMVMYVPGWVKDARRLAHDVGVRVVTPVDGIPRARLKGSSVVVLLGS